MKYNIQIIADGKPKLGGSNLDENLLDASLKRIGKTTGFRLKENSGITIEAPELKRLFCRTYKQIFLKIWTGKS